MKILLVDDSLTIRSLIRRTLADLARVEIAEAANGVEALAAIARQRFDLVVLDVNMPVMDGVETLEAIRTSPDYVGLPVVMLTSERNEAVVRRMVELGIIGFLPKPLSQDALGDRLSTILQRLKDAGTGHPGEQPGRRVLVVEQDPDLRHFLVASLSSRYQVVEADSAASALQMCFAQPAAIADLIVVGENVGLPPALMFVTRLRGLAQTAQIPTLCVVRRGSVLNEKLRPLVLGAVEYSPVPDVFLAEIDRAVSGTRTPLGKILAMRPSLRRDVVRAIEQVFGMMLASEVELVGQGPLASRPGPADCVHASIALEADAEAVLTLHFQADGPSARAIAGRMIGVPPADVQDADVLASGAELVNIVMGRLRNRLVEAGSPAQVQLPRTWTCAGDATPMVDDPEALEFPFASPRLDVTFQLVLSASTGPAKQA